MGYVEFKAEWLARRKAEHEGACLGDCTFTNCDVRADAATGEWL